MEERVGMGLTGSQRQQRDVERKVEVLLEAFATVGGRLHSPLLELWRDQHIDYLLHGLEYLGPGFCILDANRPWLCYWILHSLALLGEGIDANISRRTIDFLMRCQDPCGGYGGGPGQIPHLATTYAAVCALATLGGDALASIDREKVLQFFLRMKDRSGGFRMHENGEIDVRGCYIAIAVAHLLDIITPSLVENVADYIVSCQTYEGGIGGEPGVEAHGGYTYCGLAALTLINQAESLDLPRLLNWAVFRQGKAEGGLQGRTNKLVDGCYSFWQGGVFPILKGLVQDIFSQQVAGFRYYQNDSRDGFNKADVDDAEDLGMEVQSSSDAGSTKNARYTAAALFPALEVPGWNLKFGSQKVTDESDESCLQEKCNEERSDSSEHFQVGAFFNSQALQGYILLCCQVLDGGLRDKPGKSRDFYHTCYCLSGLSTAQYCSSKRFGAPPLTNNVLGPYNSNLLAPTHPFCNVVLERYYEAHRYFSSLPKFGP